MDDDDGFVLNFATTSAPPAKRRVVSSSGSRKERQKRSQSAKKLSNRPPPPSSLATEPVQPVAAPTGAQVPTAPTTSRPAPAKSTARKAIISSLFSSRPEKAETKAGIAQEPGKPSNAPAEGTFASLSLHPHLIEALSSPKLAIARPTPIQSTSLPLLLSPTLDHDVILQAQTGSGKTLSYLLPILQDLISLAATKGGKMERNVGTMAVILVPTRELATQIFDTAQALLDYRSPRVEGGEGVTRVSTRWIAPGLLVGGQHRQHEKAKLRKGIPLLIATPGRLLDHLQATTSFRLAGEPPKKQRKVEKGEDEFDIEDNPYTREAGEASEESEDDFSKPTSRSYRPRFADAPPDPDLTLRWLVLDEADRLMDMGFEPQIRDILTQLAKRKRLTAKRRTILCSATMQESVEKLAGMALRKPKTLTADAPSSSKEETTRHAPPAQLVQSFAIVPPKLRFVALVALLRRLLSPVKKGGENNKALVFVSCTAAVDLLWSAIGGLQMGRDEQEGKEDGLAQRSVILPGAAVYRLHGNLDLATRLASLKAFSTATGSAALICTSVAARGLDVPFVRSVVQYDLPTEGGVNEYIHRVGRTARAGRAGEAWSFLLPSEAKWVDWAQDRMRAHIEGVANTSMTGVDVDQLLERGFGGAEYETRATDVQMAFERWVEKSSSNASLARIGFLSHVRAYATHPADEKHLFHVRNLHLGHLAKSFGLRDAPGDMRLAGTKRKEVEESSEGSGDEVKRVKQPRTGRGREGKGLPPARADASEFAIAGGGSLEAMLTNGKTKVGKRR